MIQKSKNQIIVLSKRLIAIESIESNIRGQEICLDILESTFKKDFHARRYVFRDHPALVLSTTTKKHADIIFSGHIDVVSGEKSMFKPIMKGTKLYGRGAYDMKAGIVACIYAAVEYRKNGGDKEITIMITSDEETTGHGTRMLLEKERYRGDFAFIADGGNDMGIVLKQKGFMQLKVVVPGKSAHAAYVWEGDNALLKVLRLQETVGKTFPDPSIRDEWRTSVVLTKVETNNSANQVPGSAIAYFDIRYVNVKDPVRITALIRKVIGKKGAIEVGAENGMFSSEENNHYVQTLARILHEQTKKDISFMCENGTSDAIFFTEHGIPASLFRPRGGGAHQHEEWVDTHSLHAMYGTLVEFLKQS